MFCVNCGHEIENGAAFCTACGSKVSGKALDKAAPEKVKPKLSVEAEHSIHEGFSDINKKAKQCVIASGINVGLSIVYMVASFSNITENYTEVFGGLLGVYALMFSIVLLGVSIPTMIISSKNLGKTNESLGAYRAGTIVCIVLSAHIMGVGIFASVLLGAAFLISAAAVSTGAFAGAVCFGTSIFISVRGGNTLKTSNALNRSYKDMK